MDKIEWSTFVVVGNGNHKYKEKKLENEENKKEKVQELIEI